MSIPVLVLLGFAAWTLLSMFATIGVYRWSRILSGRAEIAEWRADVPQGSDWYQRALRAHMNCVENLPIYAAVVIALLAADVQSAVIDGLAITMLLARVGQTSVHIALPASTASASLRFSLYLLQVVCMLVMGTMAGAALMA
jgi:uncharacterized MAPEG superfamily protein